MVFIQCSLWCSFWASVLWEFPCNETTFLSWWIGNHWFAPCTHCMAVQYRNDPKMFLLHVDLFQSNWIEHGRNIVYFFCNLGVVGKLLLIVGYFHPDQTGSMAGPKELTSWVASNLPFVGGFLHCHIQDLTPESRWAIKKTLVSWVI